MLTDRQCWDVMRSMIKQNNAEYKSFLFKFFDTAQMAQVSAEIRDTFLKQCKISGQNLVVGLEDYAVQNSTKLSKTSWIDNLSSEDLLFFLDYRCRVLQKIYTHYKKFNSITKHDIKYICANTAINKLIIHNNGRLVCGGRPEKEENELTINELKLDAGTLQSIAINQIVDELMERCVNIKNQSLNQAYGNACELSTYNVDPYGHVTGCAFNSEKSEFLDRMLYNPKPKHCGFDIQGSPVYEFDEKYYSSVGNNVNCEDIIYSIDDEVNF